MILTTKGRFAVMALVDIAMYCKDNPVSLSDISKRQNIDIGYLEQIFIRLKQSNLVLSFRGPGGGYRLARESNKIIISEVMQAAEEDIKMTRCAGHAGNGCMNDKSICLTHHLWETLEDKIHGYLSSITLADVCNENIPLRKNAA